MNASLPTSVGSLYCTICRNAFCAITFAATLLTASAYGADSDLDQSLRAIAVADGSTAIDQAAAGAANRLQSLPSTKITAVLSGFHGDSKRGRNWLRALAADVSDNGPFQKDALLKFFNDRSGDADARYVAFQLLTQHDGNLQSKLLENAASDPSLPVRYLKIQS